MKFLRRLGRKVKKGIKKLMGSKLGRIVGMIGLSMAMGAVAKNLIGKFGAKAAGEATATAAAEATAAGATEAATAGATEAAGAAIEEIAVTATKRGAGDAVSAGAGQLATGGETAGGVGQVIEDVANAGSNSEAATTAINHIEAQTMSSNGMINPDAVNVSSSITESVDAVNNTFFDPNYQPSLSNENLLSQDLPSFQEMREQGTLTADASGATSITQSEAPSLLEPVEVTAEFRRPPGMSDADFEKHLAAGREANFLTSASLGEKIKYRAGQFGSNVKSNWDSPAEIVAGTTQGLLTGAAMNMIMGEEDPTRAGVVMPQPIQEAPIASNITPLAASYRPEDLMTKMKQINNPQTGLVFGTGSRAFMTGLMNPNAVVFQTVGLPTAQYNKEIQKTWN